MNCHTAAVDAQGRLEGNSSFAIVPWWSFTKPLIAACILRLSEKGLVAIDQPLPGFPYTSRDLLQHCAGVGDYGNLPEYHRAVSRGDAPWSDQELLSRIPPGKLAFPPGGGWSYSNVGYLLLRRLIEKTCGTGLEEALSELVLAPLNLRSCRLAQTPADMGSTIFEGGHGYHPGWAFHGFVIGPVAEAALALHRLLHGELLTPSSRAAMLECYSIGGSIPGRPWVTTGYGLGLMVGTMKHAGMTDALHVIGHSAGGPNSVGAVYHAPDPRNGRTVACFTSGSDQGIAENEALDVIARD